MANKHLSYKQFKDIFGDLGLTKWVKFNWLGEAPISNEYEYIEYYKFNRTDIKQAFLIDDYIISYDDFTYKLMTSDVGDTLYSYNSLFCTNKDADTFESWISEHKINFRTNNSPSATLGVLQDNKPYTFEFGYTRNTSKIYVKIGESRAEATNSIGAFGKTLAIGPYPGGNTPSDYKLNQFQIYQEGVLTHNLVPVIRKSDRKYCLYNTLSGIAYELIPSPNP